LAWSILLTNGKLPFTCAAAFLNIGNRTMTLPCPLIVIGTSRGGLQALRRILAALPEHFAATVLVAMHVAAHDSHLPELLGNCCPLPVRHAVDGEPLSTGEVLIAPPDKHLVVDKHHARLVCGSKEHASRPAIDPLFRSAAINHRTQVIGVILTGDLDDGTVGLQAVKACGGVALVQDPAEAVAPGMPSSALRHVSIDGCLPLAELGARLVALVEHAPSERALDGEPA
jgi:two-component system chemotaxis response regulator CheB